jgi:hypothetical protein
MSVNPSMIGSNTACEKRYTDQCDNDPVDHPSNESPKGVTNLLAMVDRFYDLLTSFKQTDVNSHSGILQS